METECSCKQWEESGSSLIGDRSSVRCGEGWGEGCGEGRTTPT